MFENNIIVRCKQIVRKYILLEYQKQYLIKLINWLKFHLFFHFNLSNSTRFKKYEIYWINFGINIWTEFWEKRPWVIFKSNKYIRWKDIIVLPITSLKANKIYWDFDIKIKKTEINNLKLDSVIKLEHIKSISKSRIWDYIWKVDKNIIQIIDNKIIKMLLK